MGFLTSSYLGSFRRNHEKVKKLLNIYLSQRYKSTGNHLFDSISIENIAELFQNRTNVVVMAGARISTASGVPDFRTPGTGLYDNLQKYNLPYPEAVFDIEYFRYNSVPFYQLACELYPSGKFRPNKAHYFVRLLQEKGLLLRMYTQNIDGLERFAGIREENLVEAHGTFTKATCTKCRQTYKGREIERSILKGEVAYCTREKCKGVIKPDIVFFGEHLPDRFYNHLNDMPKSDLLLVMGTSLEVYPFAAIAEEVKPETPRLLLNMHATHGFNGNNSRDIVLLGDLVKSVSELCSKLGWSQELDTLIKGHEIIF